MPWTGSSTIRQPMSNHLQQNGCGRLTYVPNNTDTPRNHQDHSDKTEFKKEMFFLIRSIKSIYKITGWLNSKREDNKQETYPRKVFLAEMEGEGFKKATDSYSSEYANTLSPVTFSKCHLLKYRKVYFTISMVTTAHLQSYEQIK